MPIKFNAEEIFEMAMQAERNASVFYRRAAELNRDEADCAFLVEMADMEDDHEKIFADMSKTLSESETGPTAWDPYDEGLMYLDTFVDHAHVEGAPDIAARLTGDEPMAEILKTALDLEKAAILFYLGIKDMVPPALGRDKVDGIIAEEKKHVVTLNNALKQQG